MRVLRSVLAAAALAVIPGGPVAAHDGSTTSLQAPVERTPPGSSLPVIGLDFFPGERLRMVLVDATGTSSVLSSVQAGADGHFEAVLDVPASAAAGLATISAISESGIIVRALVTLDPSAPPASYRPVFPTVAETVPAPAVDVVPIVAASLAVLALGILVVRTRATTRPR